MSHDFAQATHLSPAFYRTTVSNTNSAPRRARIALVNIMDNAAATEDHFRSIIERADPHAEIVLCRMACAKDDLGRAEPLYFRDKTNHLLSDRYVDWHDVIGQQDIDLVIVTGIDRGGLTYQELETQYPLFWNETRELLNTIDATTKTGQTGHSLLICWAAFAAMKVWSNVDKGIHDQKLYGVFDHKAVADNHPLLNSLQGRDFKIPHSRMSYMNENELRNAINHDGGQTVLEGPGGPAIWTLHDGRMTAIIGHPEYGESTLQKEQERDTLKLRDRTNNPDAVFPAPANYSYGSAGTTATFDYLKTTFCPTLYKNLVSLAKQQKDRENALNATMVEASEFVVGQRHLAF